ncbi:hypothetical protein [Pedobacter caeni]|uniref:Uncharacterized protein n=1 Tax=Pedobacter caeni TaxID=288992 RepID=A0A1M4WWD8_9SPHI|nr:hypothetical protein [Pedobacter caeni]SHE85467.1 hypothetical protein SAMN04488522_1011407 [Pedobacter caeni]
MGAYNILKMNINCKYCNATCVVNIQFKFADTWQHQYLIGEKVMWGGADIGIPGLDKVKVYGVSDLDKCPTCRNLFPYEYDIFIEKDIIKYVNHLADFGDYNTNDGNYIIC